MNRKVFGTVLGVLTLCNVAFAQHDAVECGTHTRNDWNPMKRIQLPVELPVMQLDSYELVMGIRYSPSAATKIGGVDALEAQVTAAITGANTLLSDSGINAHIVLGYLTALNSDPDENGSYPVDACPACEELNKQARPDIFVLLEENGLGFSSIPTSVAQALSGVNQMYGVVNFKQNTVAHEVGHGLGLFHGSRDPIDTRVRGTAPEVLIPDYGLGVVGIDENGDEFHTIMSYGNLSNTSVASRLFSSPDLTFNGVPTGTEEANSVRAANFFARYVSAAGERRFPSPISLQVLRNGQQSILSGDCLNEVAGDPSEGEIVSLIHRSTEGVITPLGDVACDEFGNFLLTVDMDLGGTFQATHRGISQSTDFVEALFVELSLFGTIESGETRFSGVCFEADGVTPSTGSVVELVRITDTDYVTVTQASCDANGRFQMTLDGKNPGRYEAQIIGKAFSEIIEVGSNGGGSNLTPKQCKKKKKKLKKKIKRAKSRARKKRLRKKRKQLPC